MSNSDQTTIQQLWTKISAMTAKHTSTAQLFENNPERAQKLTASACGIHMDFSKQRLSTQAFDTMVELAHAAKLPERINALLGGEVVNPTENRPALHSALRMPANNPLMVAGTDVNQQVHKSLDKLEQMVETINSHQWKGFTGKAITDVVNLGVGGSDLGPAMANVALEEYTESNVSVHFASTIDGSQLASILPKLNAETTLFILASKSFSTIDTLSNADTALAWLAQSGASETDAKQKHFIGVSTKPEKMTDWGILEDNQLHFWDWVGGRFSLWSAIGLPIAIALGTKNFRDMLAGAHAIDEHYKTAPLEQNLPAILGLLAVWNSSVLKINAHSVLPYDGRLKLFPSYLTQLEMESNGKSVTLDGTPVQRSTCPILWGEIGPNAQHAFYQLLHQGTQNVACDFIAPIKRYSSSSQMDESLQVQHQHGLANCLAQSRVLAFGNKAVSDEPQANTHKHYRGNQPSTTMLLDELTPYSLGALVALYEHKVFTMSVLWDINPFDQWGVEIGKVMATTLGDALSAKQNTGFDASTNALLAKINQA